MRVARFDRRGSDDPRYELASMLGIALLLNERYQQHRTILFGRQDFV